MHRQYDISAALQGKAYSQGISFIINCVQATFVILVTASLLVTCRQYIGDPIDCIVEEIPRDAMDTYCWIHSTFRSEFKICCQNINVMLGLQSDLHKY